MVSNTRARSEPRRLSVLVVDDDRAVCELLREYLVQQGCRVRTLCDPTQALEELRGDDYHVVVLDLVMPELSGLELLEQIRNVDHDVAVIVLTGKPDLHSATRSITLDVDAYVTKPFWAGRLNKALARIRRKKGLVANQEQELLQLVGRRIRLARRAQGRTLAQVARWTGLSSSLMSQVERAESAASIGTLYKIATALGVKLRDLFEQESRERSQ